MTKEFPLMTETTDCFQLDRGDQRHEFDRLVLESDLPVLVEFYADWCPPCRFLHPVLQHVAEQANRPLRVVKVNVDRLPDLAIHYNIRGIPTVVLFYRGREISRTLGVKPPAEYLAMVDSLENTLT